MSVAHAEKVARVITQLVPARPFVHVMYEHYKTLAEYKAAIERRRHDPTVDFIDGFIHARDHYTLNVGRFVDEAPYVHSYDWLKVYYKSTRVRRADYLRTPQYFFRYDHGVTNVFPKSFLGRLLLGKVFDSATLLRTAEKLHLFLSKDRPEVTVDLFFPFSRIDAFLDWYDDAFESHYPLWVVPYRRVKDYPWIGRWFYDGVRDDLFVDLAIYGKRQPPGRNLYKELEAALARIGGVKTLISHNFYDARTFWRLFDRDAWLAAKRVGDPRGLFRDLYSKTHPALVSSRRPPVAFVNTPVPQTP